jgi:hypothetical protein
MSPTSFGLRLAALAWVVILVLVVLVCAVSAAMLAGTDPFAATIWGFYAAALLAVPTLGVSLIVGAAGWAWARSRVAPNRPTPLSARTPEP